MGIIALETQDKFDVFMTPPSTWLLGRQSRTAATMLVRARRLPSALGAARFRSPAHLPSPIRTRREMVSKRVATPIAATDRDEKWETIRGPKAKPIRARSRIGSRPDQHFETKTEVRAYALHADAGTS
jgi:hypothetical protein